MKIKVEFDNLRPFHSRADVFYKGFKVGHVVSIEPANHYKTMIVTLAIHPKNTKLPSNTNAKLKVHRTKWQHKDYIELVYPLEPTNDYLKNGSVIKGTSSMSYEAYLSNISEETYLKMEKNIKNTLENLEGSTELLVTIFAILSDILEESKPNINTSISNFEKTTKSTSEMLEKINSSIDEKKLKSSVSNIMEATNDINKMTSSFANTAEQIDKNLPEMINETDKIVKNIGDITLGVSSTLRKGFGGLKLLFGKSINDGVCCE